MNNIELKPDVKIHSFMENLIFEVARKHPDWTISSNTTDVAARHFTVTHANGNMLGRIRLEQKYVRGDAVKLYSLENWRISETRQRGTSLRTSKPKEALRAIEKYFYPLTTNEIIKGGLQEAMNLVASEVYKTTAALDESHSMLYAPMMAYIENNWDRFVTTLNGAHAAEAVRLAEKQQLRDATKELHDNLVNNKNLTVAIVDDKYRVHDRGVTFEYESETLPESIKTKIGLLKLVDNKQVLPDIGIRVNNCFVIRHST